MMAMAMAILMGDDGDGDGYDDGYDDTTWRFARYPFFGTTGSLGETTRALLSSLGPPCIRCVASKCNSEGPRCGMN
jgi:hypothetical protein